MDICVIGLSSMGKRRIRLLKRAFPGMKIVGIDIDRGRVEAVGQGYGIDCYQSLDEAGMPFDCAFICTSPQSHGKLIQECLERSCHVFSEINLVDDLYEENIRLAEERQKVLFLSSTPMYRDEMRFIEERVRQDGTPCAYQYHVGQYLPDWHPWESLDGFFASEKRTNGCRELLAIELPWIQKAFGRIVGVNVVKRKLTGLGLDFSDTYMLQIEHKNGNVGDIVVDVVSRQAVRKIEVFNESLYIRWDGTPDSLYERDIASGRLRKVKGERYIHEEGYADFINEYAYAEEIKAFFDAIDGKEPSYNFREDKELLKIIDKIEK